MRGGSKTLDFFKKNGLFILIGILLIAAIIISIILFTKPVETFTSNKKLELFYMEQCPHCVEFHPVWDKLVDEIKSKNINVGTAKYEVSSTEGKPRADAFKITSAPTILLTENDKIIKEYSGKRDVPSILAFLQTSL